MRKEGNRGERGTFLSIFVFSKLERRKKRTRAVVDARSICVREEVKKKHFFFFSLFYSLFFSLSKLSHLLFPSTSPPLLSFHHDLTVTVPNTATASAVAQPRATETALAPLLPSFAAAAAAEASGTT